MTIRPDSDWFRLEISEDQLEFPFLSSPTDGHGPVALWHLHARHGATRDRQILAELLAAAGEPEPSTAAAAMLREFGSISDALSGSWWRLRRGAGPRLARLIVASRNLMRAALAERVAQRPLLSSSRAVLDYLRLELAFFERERLIAMYLDNRARLLRIIRLGEGGHRGVAVDRARIFREGLNLGAAGFILVHNHPSGDPRPSKSDRLITAELARLAIELEMPLVDHLIVARGEMWSFTGLSGAK